MRKSSVRGFSLIEVVVAIAIVMILAGAMAPLAMKALNQQREQTTRANMKVAWEAMFGSRDHRTSNMRADFGFDPGGLIDLRALTTSPGPPVIRPWSPDPGNGGMTWGWAGPYWTGSTTPAAGTQGIPVDGWGKAFQLTWDGTNWQLQSAGPNGVFGGAVQDDILYPTALAPRNNYLGSLTVNVARINPGSTTVNLNVTVTVYDRRNALPTAVTASTSPSSPVFPVGKHATPPWTYSVMPGSVRISVSANDGTTTNTNDQVIDLLPGESKTLDFNFD